MSDIAVVYWSGTGNTEAMANLVAEGVKSAGKSVDVISADNFSAGDIGNYAAVAFGCPSMGDEILEEEVFEPMFSSVEGSLSGKKIALFGSYGWGDGQWMRDWVDRCNAAGANIVGDVIANEYPGDAESNDCKSLGSKLAA
ncbi:MAG: flavodoxin [Thermoplasmata archaeon]|nr:flavodoxin [Thermoplasmata archaeon]